MSVSLLPISRTQLTRMLERCSVAAFCIRIVLSKKQKTGEAPCDVSLSTSFSSVSTGTTNE